MMAPPSRFKNRPLIPGDKDHRAVSVLTPAALLREAPRNKGITTGEVPRVCVLIERHGD
jgi:hypothetical protein